MTATSDPRWTTGRVLQAVGMGLVLVGIVESIFVGFAESETLRSMSVELTYLGVGGGVYVVGLLLTKLGRK